jgi:TolB protein
LIILAMDEGGNTHLFAYQPEDAGPEQPLPLTRLTYGPWDDINPSLSPDGLRVAFASNRNGYWDIYLLDLNSGSVTRLTDTLEYEAAPAWSPDNQWLAYEAYVNDNLEIKIQSVTGQADIIQLTNDLGADFSPAWSPVGRQIAFVSNRSGEDEIWLADLDKSEEGRFTDVSQNPASKDTHPVWSPDGSSLVWASEKDGMRNLHLQELPPSGGENNIPTTVKQQDLGSGDWPAWSADGEILLTVLQAPNQTYLTAYRPRYRGLVLPAIQLPGSVYGLSWGRVALDASLQAIYQQADLLTPTPLYSPALTTLPEDNGGRYQLSPLSGIEVPHPFLHDLLDESFQALRRRIATETGWDFLSSLENAYVPLTAPLEPGMGNDWLYTGRAIAINTLPINAGWLVVVREDFSSETYWRIYLRALYQDGSAGMPLHDQPWDFNARNNGNTGAYEQGGATQSDIPGGYWIDFTERAYFYGWERLPALSTWRASYPAARFNEYAAMDEVDWQTAMLELYPPEAMITPTAVVPPTRTFTPTSRWYVSPTPTVTPSPRPTHTPAPLTPTSPAGTPQLLQLPTPTPGG